MMRRRLTKWRRLLAVMGVVAIVAAVVQAMANQAGDDPAVFGLPGATAEPITSGPPGPTGGPSGGDSPPNFQPPGMPSANPGYNGGSYPEPGQNGGVDINSPAAQPGEQGAQQPGSQSGQPGDQSPVHGTQPPDYDRIPTQTPATRPSAAQEQVPQEEPRQSSAPDDGGQDQALRDLQQHCDQIAQQLGITEPVMVLPANLASGDLRDGPGETVGGGAGVCSICPPQHGPQNGDFPQRRPCLPNYHEADIYSPNHEPRDPSNIRWIIMHTQEGGGTATSLAENWLGVEASQVSYHWAVDNATIVNVIENPGSTMSYSAAAANPYSLNLVIAGSSADWTPVQWARMFSALQIAAFKAAQQALLYGIPLVKLTPDQIQQGASGFANHSDGGEEWGGHHDMGQAFPWDSFMNMVKGYARCISNGIP